MYLFFSIIIIWTNIAIAKKDTWVSGYTRKNGTYVSGHHRSAPDGNFGNNWSTKGNLNPYTGEEGTKSYPSAGNSAELYTSSDNYSSPSPSNSSVSYDNSNEVDVLKQKVASLESENEELKKVKDQYEDLKSRIREDDNKRSELEKWNQSTTQPLSKKMPSYSTEERLQRAQGLVVVKVVFDSKGMILSTDLVKSSGTDSLDSKSIKAIKKWKYPKKAGVDYAKFTWRLTGEPPPQSLLRRSNKW